ncbi:hypothetical protein GCM10010151_07440 [Actinoallomurus spadix]|uniref:Uncharacterized protein n=1 Tax=Actinoallomurus spadix TaxID=79912 RepID=A0ABP3FP52_9ACTN
MGLRALPGAACATGTAKASDAATPMTTAAVFLTFPMWLLRSFHV